MATATVACLTLFTDCPFSIREILLDLVTNNKINFIIITNLKINISFFTIMATATVACLFADCPFSVREILLDLVTDNPINTYMLEDYIAALPHIQSRALRRKFWASLSQTSPALVDALAKPAASFFEDTAEDISQLPGDNFKEIAFRTLLEETSRTPIDTLTQTQLLARLNKQASLFRRLLPESAQIDFETITPRMRVLILALLRREKDADDGPIHLKFGHASFYQSISDFFADNNSDLVTECTHNLLALLPARPDRQWLFNLVPEILYTILDNDSPADVDKVCDGISPFSLRPSIMKHLKNRIESTNLPINKEVRRKFCEWLGLPVKRPRAPPTSDVDKEESDDSFICDSTDDDDEESEEIDE